MELYYYYHEFLMKMIIEDYVIIICFLQENYFFQIYLQTLKLIRVIVY